MKSLIVYAKNLSEIAKLMVFGGDFAILRKKMRFFDAFCPKMAEILKNT